MKLVLPWLSGTCFGCAALILPLTSFSRAAFVFSAVLEYEFDIIALEVGRWSEVVVVVDGE
jgi:hypothetical protein